MEKVLFVLAKNGFKDIEFSNPSSILKKAGHEIFVASNAEIDEMARGAEGMEIKIDYSLAKVKPENFDIIVFIGGSGALENLDNEESYRIIRATVGLNKPLGVICIAPVILAKAGVLKNKKATVWSSPTDKNPIEILRSNGADYQNQTVVVDGNIITANGPQASEEFGMALLKLGGKR